MNLYNYLSTVNRLWNNEDGSGISRFVSVGGNHAAYSNLHVDSPESAVERAIPSPLDEVISNHIKVLFYLHDNRKK
jgi:nuclear mRNA export protein PCID2/THP1